MSISNDEFRDFNTVRERLSVVTQETRISIVHDILGHPSGLPTLKELVYINSTLSQTPIYQHLQRLIGAGIVEKVKLPEGRRQNDLPYTFYGISEEGQQFLEAHQLLRSEETLGETYERVEKTEVIKRYESAPRPEWRRTTDSFDSAFSADSRISLAGSPR